MTIPTSAPQKNEAWGPKLRVRINRQQGLAQQRPLTATLERPLVLDVALLKKLDMTTFTKQGLLTIINMCGVSLVKKTEAKTRKVRRGRFRRKDEEEGSRPPRAKTLGAVRPRPARGDSWTEDSSASEMKSAKSSEHSDKSDKGPRRPRADRYLTNNLGKISSRRAGSIDEVFGGPVRHPVPEPCKACGREDQPERFHSHPKGPAMKPGTAKTAIAKPVPAKFKSADKTRRDRAVTVLEAPVAPRPRSGRPRTVTCYLCAREFGTTSYHLHEPKCLQKWERENAALPAELRRKLPEKPTGQVSLEDWNNFAWKASQQTLVPCERCGRTFNPDRLQVHQRSCKDEGGKRGGEEEADVSSPQVMRPRTVVCYICGREFGTQSIGIHEPQCLKKWRLANEQLPPGQRRPEPVKRGQLLESPGQSPQDMKFVTGCYVCGEQMSAVARIHHERTCIKAWRDENAKLPAAERKPEPVRPDFRFTELGTPDNAGTFQSIWANHVDSLVACRVCGRKFFPDRIQRHEECCNNNPYRPGKPATGRAKK